MNSSSLLCSTLVVNGTVLTTKQSSVLLNDYQSYSLLPWTRVDSPSGTLCISGSYINLTEMTVLWRDLWNLKSGWMFLEQILCILRLLHCAGFLTNLTELLSAHQSTGCGWSLDILCMLGYFYPSYSWTQTWDAYPFLNILFNFIKECFIVSCTTISTFLFWCNLTFVLLITVKYRAVFKILIWYCLQYSFNNSEVLYVCVCGWVHVISAQKGNRQRKSSLGFGI